MRFAHLLAVIAAFALSPMYAIAADAIAVIDHSIVGFKSSPGISGFDIIVIKLEVEYSLTSKPKAVLRFVVDRDAEMSFATVDQKDVAGEKKKKKAEVTVRLTKYARDTLHGIVMLQDPDAPAGATPIVMTGLSLDMKKIKSG